MTIRTPWRTLALYSTELRVARAVFDHLVGLDPGAVRLAQMIASLLRRRRVAPRDR